MSKLKSKKIFPLFQSQRFNYSPLPVKRRNRKPTRSKPTQETAKLKNSIERISPFWNPNNQQTNYSWTDYGNIPTRIPILKETSKPSPIIIQVPNNPNGILKSDHPAAQLLSQSALVIVRQLEMMNLFIGFEQANRYRILNPTGETIGFLAEEERGLSGTLFRQIAGTHRAFQASILNPLGHEILRIKRPFSFINSRIFIQAIHQNPSSTQENEIIGETQQEFHLWRRKYNLFNRIKTKQTNSQIFPTTTNDDEYEQFAKIDAGFLSWDFYSEDRNGNLIASVSKNFTGFGREIFTNTGQYVIRFDSIESQVDSIQNSTGNTQLASTGLTLDQRAVMLATAVSIDFDYFSRTNRGGLMPPIFFGGGGSSDDL